MEPVGWVIDTVGSRQEEPETGVRKELSKQSFPGGSGEAKDSSSQLRRTSTSPSSSSPSPQMQGRHARAAAAGSDGQDETTSQNSVESLLRRIARDVRARQARAEIKSVEHAVDRRYHESESGSSWDCTARHGRQLERQPEKRHPPTQGSARRSRWSTSEEHGGFAQMEGGDGGGRRGGDKGRPSPATAGAASDAAVPVAEANPFTESMWEDTSCRQVLQAMFFAPDSAVPAGSTEEYKELEGERKPITITITTRPTSVQATDTRDRHLSFWWPYI